MKIQCENQSRKIDEIGRITIPKSLRNRLGWNEGSPIEFYVMDDNYIVLSNGKMKDNRYDIAMEVLTELGLPIPGELRIEVNRGGD